MRMITGLSHVVLMCRDVAAAKVWYELVGFAYVNGFEGMAFFKLGDAEILLHPSETGGHVQGLTLHARVTDVNELFRHVRANGLKPVRHGAGGVQELTEPFTQPWGHREFELTDPEGYQWAFTQIPAK